MGIILNWSSVYPASIDSFPSVTDNVHDVMASQVNALATSLVEVEAENVVHKINTSLITGCVNASTNGAAAEVVVGGFVLDGGSFASLIAKLRMVGVFADAVGAAPAAGTATLRLYDVGPPGAPVPGVWRSEASIGFALGGGPRLVETTLSAVAGPVNPDEIFATARIYELRLKITGAAPGDTLTVYWGGISLG